MIIFIEINQLKFFSKPAYIFKWPFNSSQGEKAHTETAGSGFLKSVNFRFRIEFLLDFLLNSLIFYFSLCKNLSIIQLCHQNILFLSLNIFKKQIFQRFHFLAKWDPLPRVGINRACGYKILKQFI